MAFWNLRHRGGRGRSMRRRLSIALGVLAVSAAFGARASEYADAWGPPVGSTLPVLEAFDQAGTLRNLENLSGERGLLLFLSRSADW